MYRLVFNAEPTAGAAHADDIAGGMIEIWVNEDNADVAEAKARSHIMSYSWIVKELEIKEYWPKELCPNPDISPESFVLYNKAEIHGISAIFLVLSKIPRPGVHEICSLGDPFAPGGKQ